MPQTFSEIADSFVFPDCTNIKIDALTEYRAKYSSPGDPSNLYYHQFLTKDVYIGYNRMLLSSARNFDLQRSTDVIQLHFVLKGTYDFRQNGIRVAALNESEHNIIFLTRESVAVHVDKDHELEFVEIQLNMDFVERYLAEDHFIRQQIKDRLPVRISEKNMTISPLIYKTLHELIQCRFKGNLRSLYIRAKVIELFTLQLAQYEESAGKKQTGLKSSDIEKMELVKSLLTDSPEKIYSLAYLARIAGTNIQYLKSHFKKIYGKTVFEYLTDLRMERAKALLISGDRKIAEIAQEVGYRHSTHFTQAFKKHFGYLPLKIKGIRTIVYGLTQLPFGMEYSSIFSF